DSFDRLCARGPAWSWHITETAGLPGRSSTHAESARQIDRAVGFSRRKMEERLESRGRLGMSDRIVTACGCVLADAPAVWDTGISGGGPTAARVCLLDPGTERTIPRPGRRDQRFVSFQRRLRTMVRSELGDEIL